MKVTAGVVLIIAAIFNLIASLGYVMGGAVTSGTSILAEEVMKEVKKESTIKESKEIKTTINNVNALGGGLMAYGVFLVISVAVLIAGAVFLFQGTHAMFIRIAGGVAITAELIGIWIISFGIMNVFGLVGGVLALLAANSIASANSPPEEADS